MRTSVLLLMIGVMCTGAPAFAAETRAGVAVNVLNFVRARTSLQFDAVLRRSGGINRFGHVRGPIPLDQQRSKRMNRDTL